MLISSARHKCMVGKKGLRKLEMEVLSLRTLPLECALTGNMELGCVKEGYISLLMFFQLFDAGNPRWFVWGLLHVIGLFFFMLSLVPTVSKHPKRFFSYLECFKIWCCRKGKFNSSCSNSRWSQQRVLPVWQQIFSLFFNFWRTFFQKALLYSGE